MILVYQFRPIAGGVDTSSSTQRLFSLIQKYGMKFTKFSLKDIKLNILLCNRPRSLSQEQANKQRM